MNFDLIFERKLSKNFRLNINCLKQDLATLVAKSSNSYYKVGLYSLNSYTENFRIDIDGIISILNNSLVIDKNPCFLKNKLLFKIFSDNILNNNENTDILYQLNQDCFLSLFEDRAMKNTFETLILSKIFDDQRTQSNRYKIVDTKSYIENLNKIIKLLYPDFTLDIPASSRVFRFTKKISEELSIGLEYNRRILEQDLNSGIKIPIIRIILFNSDFDRKIKEEEYLYNSNKNIICISELTNPFFTPFLFDISSIFSRLISTEISYGHYSFNVDKLLNDQADLYFIRLPLEDKLLIKSL